MCDHINCLSVELYEGTEANGYLNIMRNNYLSLSGGVSITPGNFIIVGPDDIDPNTGRITLSALAHEMAHVAQYQLLSALYPAGGGTLYRTIGVATQVSNKVKGWFGPKNQAYEVGYPVSSSGRYGMEQQAEIVRFCLSGLVAYCVASPFKPSGGR
jgi:hypothetical protein